MEDYELSVPETLDGARLDKALTELVPRASRARVKKAIESGSVRVNGRRARKGTQVKTGDALSVSLEVGTELASSDAPATPEPGAPLQVRWKTPKLLVVDKPAGQPSAPLKGGEIGTLANALIGHFPELGAPGVGYSPRESGLLHRLDNDTSGLLVVGRTAEAFAALRDALHADRIAKSYLLVCREAGLPDEGTIAFPIANHPKDQRRVYACVHARDVMRYAPRPASTDYRVLDRKGGWARVEVSVARALRHQIRVHFAAIEHPLAGDLLYGGEAIRGLDRHALHASRVALEDPDPELTFAIDSPLPPELEAILGS